MTKRLIATSVLMLAIASASCSKNSPVSPTSNSGAGGTGISPVITATVPVRPIISDAPQLLRVTGQDFETTNLTFILTKPNGSSVTYVGSDVREAAASSFAVAALLDIPGDYRLEVRSFGLFSPAYTMPVRSPESGDIVLLGFSPQLITLSSQPQSIAVSGRNFDTTLIATLTAPDGAMEIPLGLSTSGSTSFILTHIFTKVGTYALSVSNSAGNTSNVITL